MSELDNIPFGTESPTRPSEASELALAREVGLTQQGTILRLRELLRGAQAYLTNDSWSISDRDTLLANIRVSLDE